MKYDGVQLACLGVVSRPVWGAWIEIRFCMYLLPQKVSRPVWGAWIEIVQQSITTMQQVVAPRMGRVD